MCDLHFCRMKITEDLRKHAAEQAMAAGQGIAEEWRGRKPSSPKPESNFTGNLEEG
jgi:hypothetical protein